VTVDEPLSLKPVIILSYALLDSEDPPPLQVTAPLTAKAFVDVLNVRPLSEVKFEELFHIGILVLAPEPVTLPT